MMNFEEFLMDGFGDLVEVERELQIGGRNKKLKFKPIGATKGDELRKKCRKVSIIKGQKVVETDTDKYMDSLIVETTVYPDLKNSELQAAWGVLGAEELLNAMKSRMTDGEFGEWSAVVSEVNGYDKGMQELIEEAKN